MRVEIQGLAELSRALGAVGGRIGAGLDSALADLADQGAQAARDRAPTDTGKLADSIAASRLGPLEYEISAGGDGGRAGLPYAGAQEFGTSQFPASPFMRPALDQIEQDAPATVAAHVSAALGGGA